MLYYCTVVSGISQALTNQSGGSYIKDQSKFIYNQSVHIKKRIQQIKRVVQHCSLTRTLNLHWYEVLSPHCPILVRVYFRTSLRQEGTCVYKWQISREGKYKSKGEQSHIKYRESQLPRGQINPKGEGGSKRASCPLNQTLLVAMRFVHMLLHTRNVGFPPPTHV